MNIKKLVIFFGVFLFLLNGLQLDAKNPFSSDEQQKNLKYQAEIQKEDAQNRRDKRVLGLFPTGYMTVDEYEAASEYKDKQTLDYTVPKFQIPSDFKYVPKPTYRIVKYNDPPGSVELSLGKKLYQWRLINAQGIVAPDYSKLVYPAIYYYTDSASVACDIFVIPLDEGGTNLSKILKANVAKRDPNPILSTEKSIDNYATFRTLTPVDFSVDGSKLLIKEKLGSSEDGIWLTNIHIYDFNNKLRYDLSEVRDAVVYFWKEYMNLNLDEKRWDIIPLGFEKQNSDRVVVQAIAYTGKEPVFLGTWSVDCLGNQSRLISFDKNYKPQISVNGYKLVKAGVESFQAADKQNKSEIKESKYVLKQRKKAQDEVVKQINSDYKQELREINDNYKEESRDYKNMKNIDGAIDNEQLRQAYKQYLIDQSKKDIEKLEKQINRQKIKIEKHNQKLEKLYSSFKESSSTQTPSSKEEDIPEGDNVDLSGQELQSSENQGEGSSVAPLPI